MQSQAEKAHAFHKLHQQAGTFLVPNPRDIGTARLLELLGFSALASTSAGYAFSRGMPDNCVGRDEVIRHLSELAAATDLPVTADLENGFGDSPSLVAETIRLAAAAGVAGVSIEDTTGDSASPVHDLELATDRIRSAMEVARGMPFPFTVTARADNYMVGRPDLKDTIKRLQAYQEAGADVLFAPGLKKREDIAAVIVSVDRPVNIMMGFSDMSLSVADLSGLGVKRISVGGSLARAALGAFLRASREILDTGTFSYAADAVSFNEINGMLEKWRTR